MASSDSNFALNRQARVGRVGTSGTAFTPSRVAIGAVPGETVASSFTESEMVGAEALSFLDAPDDKPPASSPPPLGARLPPRDAAPRQPGGHRPETSRPGLQGLQALRGRPERQGGQARPGSETLRSGRSADAVDEEPDLEAGFKARFAELEREKKQDGGPSTGREVDDLLDFDALLRDAELQGRTVEPPRAELRKSEPPSPVEPPGDVVLRPDLDERKQISQELESRDHDWPEDRPNVQPSLPVTSSPPLGAFADHRSAAPAIPAVESPRRSSEPSAVLPEPYPAMPGASVSKFAALERRSKPAEPEPPPRQYEEDRYAQLEKRNGGASSAERSARRDVNAVKVVTRLVRAIVFKPGSQARAKIKTAELQQMLADVHRGAMSVAMAAAPLDVHRPWVQAMCSTAMAELVAARNERDEFDEPLDLDAAIEVVTKLFQRADTHELVAEAIEALEASKYVEATSESIATDRVRASTGLAAWSLFDSITDPRLGSPGFRYTYNHEPQEIVSLLLEEVVKIAREANVRSNNLDLRTMHLQGSIGRVADLLGAEYIHRTRQVMNWIGEKGIPPEEYERRSEEARRSFKTVTVPGVVELTRRNFIAIEQIAPQLVEESRNAHVNSERQHHG